MKNEVFQQISIYPYPQDGEYRMFWSYLLAIELLQQLHWFNASINMIPAKKTLALFAAQLTGYVVDKGRTSMGTVVDDYLKLCTLLKQSVDKEAIKAFVFNNFDLLNHHFLIGYDSGFRNILTYFPLTDENNDLFTVMASCFQPLQLWSAYLEALKKVMPNQAFSENQLLILQKNLDILAEKMLNTQLSMFERYKAFAIPASLNFWDLCEQVKFCTEIPALKTPLDVPACMLQSLLNYLNQYADQLPSPPESFISQKDCEYLQNTLILQIEGIHQKLSIINPELSTVIERIKANPAAGAIIAGSPQI